MTSRKLFDIFFPDGYIRKLAYLPKLDRPNGDGYPKWYKGFYNGAFASSSDMTGECYRCINNVWVKQDGN